MTQPASLTGIRRKNFDSRNIPAGEALSPPMITFHPPASQSVTRGTQAPAAPRRPRRVCWLTRFAIAGLACATFATAASADFYDEVRQVDRLLAQNRDIAGAGLVVARDGRTEHEQYWGDYNRRTSIPIASTGKAISAIVILALVDDGVLDLDRPAWQYIPDLLPRHTVGGRMTLRQAFSHTGGTPEVQPALRDPYLTLEESVGLITDERWASRPGSAFAYGGESMQVGGLIVERVTGKSWRQNVEQHVIRPLGLRDTNFDGLWKRFEGTPPNPRVGGGSQSSTSDLMRILEMLSNDGVFRGRRVLSADSVRLMLSDQTGGVPVTNAPRDLGGFSGYGLGCWLADETFTNRRGRTRTETSILMPGAYGTVAWIDPANDTYGVFLIDAKLRQTRPIVDDIRAEAPEL